MKHIINKARIIANPYTSKEIITRFSKYRVECHHTYNICIYHIKKID